MKDIYPEYNGKTQQRFDLTGQRFGILTVLYRYYKNTEDNKIQWVCQCNCGKYSIKRGKDLRAGKTTSCGCRGNIQAQAIERIKELYSQTFGFLKPFDFSYDNIKKKYYLKCKCICGSTVSVSKADVLSGKTKSCGCKSKELNAFTHIIDPLPIGYTSGKLTIIGPLQFVNNQSCYLCQCECGNQKEISHARLSHKVVFSCGCIKSKGEVMIKNILQDLNLNFKTEYIFSDLLSEKGWPLLFDFAIFNEEDQIQFLIEYDGLQHFIPSGWNTPESLERIQIRDQLKNNYCKQHNILLLRICYLYDTEERIREQIIKFLKENNLCNY